MAPTLRSLLCLAILPSIYATVTPGFPYGTEKVRGVNLGGWLVLEPWITPSLFDKTGDSRIVDELTFCQYQNRTIATDILRNHWDTWITEADFQAIAAAGLNHVRIPIGYWAYDVSAGEPYIQGQILYLTKAIGWAQKHGIKVLVDLHGVPGSQNGFDNSGQKMASPKWYTSRSNIARANAIIKTIANTYKDMSSVVTAIEPLNEPAGYVSKDIMEIITRFWYDSYGYIRFPYGTSQQSNTAVVLHDAFQPLSFWKGFMPSPNWEAVIMDIHIYQVFTVAENQMTDAEHISAACAQAESISNSSLWALVGEWTPATTDCAVSLNGRGVGSRYDGSYPGSTRVGSCVGKTGKAATFSAAYKTLLRKFWEAQSNTFEKGVGWIQWTWKAENSDEWSYQAGLANGWIPQDPTSRQFPNICG